MACNSNSMNFSQFTKTTKFKENQIKNFYFYFKKFAKSNTDRLTLDEFKYSLGILGVKSNDFICLRLFDLLCDKKTQRLTFDSYLSFMNLVNYGTIEEKITHSFNFFDLNQKGYIDKEDFRKVILSLCEYFSSVSSTQMKARETEIDLIFEEIVEKSESPKLDLNSFINVSQNHPEIMDFFDIFNNKILDNMTLTIHKDTLRKIETVVNKLKTLIDKTEKKNMRKNSEITIGLKSFFDRSAKNKKHSEENTKRTQGSSEIRRTFTNPNMEISNYFLRDQATQNNIFTFNTNELNFDSMSQQHATVKMFQLSDKIKNKFAEGDESFDDNELSMSDFSNDENEEINDYVFDLGQVGKTTKEIISKKMNSQNNLKEANLMDNEQDKSKNAANVGLVGVASDTEEIIVKQPTISITPFIEEDFEFIQPADLNDIKDKGFLEEIVKSGIEVNDCLIISNKKMFLNYMSELKEFLISIIDEIDPSRKVVKRRQGISINVNKNSSIEKEDFLNSPFLHKEEKGMIHFGNESVELVLNMMIGIRNSVNSIGNNKSHFNFSKNDESFKEINRFIFSQNTHDNEIKVRFYDLAPKVFFNMRKLYGIKNEDYVKSLGPENFLGNLILIKNRSLRELCSAGKSGSFFYFSYDSKFVLKTISADEFNFFAEILEDYYNHLVKNPNTLLQRFFGLHTMIFNDMKMHFVIMNNVFSTNIQVHYKYDLKGSTYQRLSRKRKENNYDDYDFNVPLKDLDYKDRKEKIFLMKQEKESLLKEIISDADFLSSKNINDYSLLIGVHNPDMYNGNFSSKQNLMEQLGNAGDHNIRSIVLGNNGSNHSLDLEESDPRKPFFEKHRGGMLSSDGKKVYFFGVIDIFTQYGAKKKFEHFFKSIVQGKGISCKPPNEYAQRFKTFGGEILE